jgi:hypothetical protein
VGRAPIGKRDKNTKLKPENLKKTQELDVYMCGWSNETCVKGLCADLDGIKSTQDMFQWLGHTDKKIKFGDL